MMVAVRDRGRSLGPRVVIWRQIHVKPLVGTGLRRSSSVRPRLHAPSSITCTAVLDVSRTTAEFLARLLQQHRERLGTRNNTRALGPFKQAVLILRWFVDGTRATQL